MSIPISIPNAITTTPLPEHCERDSWNIAKPCSLHPGHEEKGWGWRGSQVT
jgi:hypothetical protein